MILYRQCELQETDALVALSPLEECLVKERTARLSRAIEGLREPHRSIIRLSLRGEGTGEIAKRLKLRHRTVSTYRTTATAKLRRELG